MNCYLCVCFCGGVCAETSLGGWSGRAGPVRRSRTVGCSKILALVGRLKDLKTAHQSLIDGHHGA